MRALPSAKQVKQLPRVIQRGLPRLQPGQGWFVASSLVNTLGSGLFYPFSVLYFHEVAGLSLPLVGLGPAAATGLSLATVLLATSPAALWLTLAPLMLVAAAAVALRDMPTIPYDEDP